MNKTIMVGRLKCLKEIFSSLASGVYNQDGTPRLDRAFCLAGGHALIPQNLPRFSTKNGLPMTGLGNTNSVNSLYDQIESHCSAGINQFELFLTQHRITEVSTFYRGRSCCTLLAWHEDKETPSVIRIPITDDVSAHKRLKTPIVLSPDDHFQTQQKEIRIELLPYIPVLPNRGLLGNQPIPEHNTLDLREYNIKTAHGSNISPLDAFDYIMIEGCLLEFLALLNVSGYQVSCARDVGLRPDGTPVFVDPDVVRNTPKNASDSFITLLKNLEELSLPRLFDWTNARTPNP